MIEHLSASQLQLYQDCSLKYKFTYIDKLPKPFKPAGLVLGSAIHAVAEWLQKKWQMKKEVSLESAWDILEADWFAQSFQPIKYSNGETEDNVLNTGKNLISVYFNNAPREGMLETEQYFKVPLVDFDSGECLEVPLVGIFDRIEESDTVADLKTWKRMNSEEDLKSNLQLTAYSYAYRVMHKKLPSLRLDVLMKTKTPRFEPIPVTRTEADHKTFFLFCKEIYSSIQKEVFIPKPSWMCKECEFRQVCWFWNGKAN